MRWRRALLAPAILVLVSCGGPSAGEPSASPRTSVALASATADPCAAPQASQFDFWVGHWQGTWSDAAGSVIGTDTVAKTGCTLDEVFDAPRFLGAANYHAFSHSAFDPKRGVWIQDYRDSKGERSRWTGTYDGGRMTLTGPPSGGTGQRLIWRDASADAWTWEYDRSSDGTTWTVAVVIRYTRLSG